MAVTTGGACYCVYWVEAGVLLDVLQDPGRPHTGGGSPTRLVRAKVESPCPE